MHAIHTSLRLTLKTKKRFYLFVVWEFEEDSCRFISLLKYVNKRCNGSDMRWKAIPQMCTTVAETTLQTIGAGLRQSQFVFRIYKSIVRFEGFSVGVSDTPGTGHSKFCFFLLIRSPQPGLPRGTVALE